MSLTVTLKKEFRNKREISLKILLYKTLTKQEKDQLNMIGYVLMQSGIDRLSENTDIKIMAALKEWNEIINKKNQNT